MRRFILKTTLRREFPYITDRAFSRMSPRDVAFHLAFLQGLAEGNAEAAENAKSGS